MIPRRRHIKARLREPVKRSGTLDVLGIVGLFMLLGFVDWVERVRGRS